MTEQERQATTQHLVGLICLLNIDGDVFRILAKRRGLPFDAAGKILTEKPWHREALIKILREHAPSAESLKVQEEVTA